MAYGAFARVYDRLMSQMPYEEWVDYAQTCWKRYGRPKTVVDLGCGTGSISIPLADSGLSVYGIDLSADMLAVAQEKSRRSDDRSRGGPSASTAAAASIVWLEQDMREWELAEPVDAVISFCDCLNYITEANEVKAVFSRTYEGLRPGGLFLFDVHAPKQLQAYQENQPFLLDEDDIAYLWTCEWEEDRMVIQHDLTFFVRDPEDPAGRFTRFEESHVQRAYPPKELERWLTEAGFEILEITGDFTWLPADDESERIFFVARKRADAG